MSYPSIVGSMADEGLSVETASDQQLEEVLWQTLKKDLGTGVEHLQKIAQQVHNSNQRVIDIQDPNSGLGKQLIRLVGTDVARALCQKKLQIALGFYNCCVTVAAPTPKTLQINIREQINLQNGVLASADC